MFECVRLRLYERINVYTCISRFPTYWLLSVLGICFCCVLFYLHLISSVVSFGSIRSICYVIRTINSIDHSVIGILNVKLYYWTQFSFVTNLWNNSLTSQNCFMWYLFVFVTWNNKNRNSQKNMFYLFPLMSKRWSVRT